MFQRFVTGKLLDVLSYSPVVFLHGPLRCGKSTVIKALSEVAPSQIEGSHFEHEYISFRDAEAEELVSRDPIGFVEQLPEYVILDHVGLAYDRFWSANKMFEALRTRIEVDRKPGAFILTGTPSYFMGEIKRALGPELACLPMYPLAQCEVNHRTVELSFKWGTNRLLSCLLEGRVPIAVQNVKLFEKDLANIVVDGGYPEALQLPIEHRREWYSAYVNAMGRLRFYMILRGIDAIPKFMSKIAEQTTSFFNLSRLSRHINMRRDMLQSLVSMLHESFFIEVLSVWPTNKVSRVKSRKLYMADTGLASLMLNLDSEQLWRNRSLFEKLVENLIFLELRRQLSWMKNPIGLYHCQDKDQGKVDFIIEQPDRSIIGINVIAGGSVSNTDFNGLRHVASRVQNFKFGVILYDGESVIPFDQRMLAVPIRMLFEDSSVE